MQILAKVLLSLAKNNVVQKIICNSFANISYYSATLWQCENSNLQQTQIVQVQLNQVINNNANRSAGKWTG